VVATKGTVTVTDEIELTYQTQPWGSPAELRLTEKMRNRNISTVEAKLYDAHGVLCLDGHNTIRFSLAGDGKLLDNLGTSRGSRELQLYNGRAEISVTRSGGCTFGVSSEGLPSAFLKLS
jgi:beta-galactosidase